MDFYKHFDEVILLKQWSVVSNSRCENGLPLPECLYQRFYIQADKIQYFFFFASFAIWLISDINIGPFVREVISISILTKMKLYVQIH